MCIHTYTHMHIHMHVCMYASTNVSMCVSLNIHTHMHAYKHLRIAMFRLDHTIPFNQSVADIFHLANKLKKQQHTNTSHLHIQ